MTGNWTKRVIGAQALDKEWLDAGGSHIWLPYTQMKNAPTPLMAERTEGSRIYLKDGRVLVDGIASWWTACHGYNHPHILAAMDEQLRRMPHVMFGGINHEPALRLARRLAAITPGDLDHVFFSDSGSVAVEVALKMAVQYWLNKGETGRTKFVSFRHGYHGDTAACMAVCDPEEGMHTRFNDYLPRQFIAGLPQDEKSKTAFDDLLKCEKERIAAVIVEPLVQGYGGMRFYDMAVLRGIADTCARYGILLIADEIFTGFGRTGAMFACTEAAVVPDIMCLGKALTGGVITLAATVARRHIFDAFRSDEAGAAFMHGPTYMANPLACAAANASLDLFESEPRLVQAMCLETALRDGLMPCRQSPLVVDVRAKGAIGVVQLQDEIDATCLRRNFIDKGVWVRPIRNIVYLTPAFTIEPADLAQLTKTVCAVIKAAA
ncbi:MAG: adenosylmethionine--8-amino-7-oxononanoate transaminase [Bdellovibrionales bacterium]